MINTIIMGDISSDFHKVLGKYRNLVFTFLLYRMSHSLKQKLPIDSSVPSRSSGAILFLFLLFMFSLFFGVKFLIISNELT